MGKIIKTSGEIIDFNPANGKEFTLEEMQGVVGGYIELTLTADEKNYMVINEEGKLNSLPLNPKATEIFNGNTNSLRDIIVGDVLLASPSEIS